MDDGRGRADAKPTTFARRVASLHAELAKAGLTLPDMRRADSLELHLAGALDSGVRTSPPTARGIERLEGDPIVARRVEPIRPAETRLRYFLDGTQRTLPVFRCGLIPVVATIAAAAVLQRDRSGHCAIAPGMLRMEHVWLIPRRAGTPEIEHLVRSVERQGMAIEDPLDDKLDDDDYASWTADYGAMLDLAYERARRVRERLERQLLRQWSEQPERADDDWLVVDGRLHLPVSRAVGIVKQFSDHYLTPSELTMMLAMRPGERTTSFRPNDYHRRSGPEVDDADPTALTLWYQRFWDATGLDARHALIRVEVGSEVRDTDTIDAIAGWLMSERTPRATADARWATLLYPVHLLERMLKRRLEADTRGWAAGSFA